ncbi:MAG: uracil-DNA glycosylase family protein, partial [Candidatus Symbiothrix sp.]|nr:uracil-DNA glycosylase family protein [Candidatus Symbiothrix sp.]
MKEYKFSVDESKTKERMKKLKRYLHTHVLTAEKKFICSCCKECKKSHDGIFGKGQLHHLGHKYDLIINGIAIRIMIVGQEWGCEEKITLEENHESKMECGELYFSERNPHMKGTTSVLRLLFGKNLGSDHESEYLKFTDGGTCHIFDAFSLCNYLICSALKKETGKAGYSTSVMKNNCQQHFKKALEILEPNVVIVQGKGIWKWVADAFDNIKVLKNSDGSLYQAEINGNTALVASFTHPSAPNIIYNWGMPEATEYLRKTVK